MREAGIPRVAPARLFVVLHFLRYSAVFHPQPMPGLQVESANIDRGELGPSGSVYLFHKDDFRLSTRK